MKTKDFKNNILISYNFDNIFYNTLLYTPIQYLIPCCKCSSSKDDTEKYYFDKFNFTSSQVKKMHKEFNKERSKLMEKTLLKAAFNKGMTHNYYQEKLEELEKQFPEKPPMLRLLNSKDNIKSLKGYFIINPISTNFSVELFLVEFMNLNLKTFNDFFIFFTKYFSVFIKYLSKKDLEKILIDELIDISLLKDIAKNYWKDAEIIKKLEYMQKIFRNFIDTIYNLRNSKKFSKLNLKQRFFFYYNIGDPTLIDIANNYKNVGMFNFGYSQNIDLDYTLDEKNMIEKFYNDILEYDSEGELISNQSYIYTNNIFSAFYFSLYNLVDKEFGFIKKCKNCRKYFYTDKKNVTYCDNIFHNNKTCKEIGKQLSQKGKENSEPVYGKYRSIYAKKSTLLKRYPDIYSKEDYEKWKTEAKKFISEIKNGTKTYEDFDKWLNKNK